MNWSSAFLWIIFAPVPVSFELEVKVRPTDLDTNGHVNNARYVEYCQWARWEWLGKLDKSKVIFVVVNINLDYRKECGEGETLRVKTDVVEIKERSLTLRHRIVKADGQVAVEGTITVVAVDPRTKKSRPLPESFK
jgi:thioesterase-3